MQTLGSFSRVKMSMSSSISSSGQTWLKQLDVMSIDLRGSLLAII